jgi:hypothetical protein
MTSFIVGIAIMALAIVAFFYSLPRAGKLAPFVGSEWEAYVVVAMLGGFAGGLLLAITGATPN